MQNCKSPVSISQSVRMLQRVRDASASENDDCWRQGIAFLPMVVESFGGWHEASAREVERLGAALARHTGQEEKEAVRHMWGKLGMLLQRGNAQILANRVPSFPAPEIDGQQ